MDPWQMMLGGLGSAGGALLSNVGQMHQQRRAMALQALQEQGERSQEELTAQEKKNVGALGDLIDAYRSSLTG